VSCIVTGLGLACARVIAAWLARRAPPATPLRVMISPGCPRDLMPRKSQMNHSFCSADRATHCRIVGLACISMVVVSLIGIGYFAKSEQMASAPALQAGMPVVPSDGGYAIIR
jgi:hypothetical protein